MKKTNVGHVIDDDPLILSSLEGLLENEGFAVETHTSAYSFLRHATTRDVGCIVTDVEMPGMNGLDLMERLSEAGLDCPVIVLTGRANAEIAVEAAALGAADFIEKPSTASALIAGVRPAW